MKKHGFISVVTIVLSVTAICGAKTITVPGDFSSIQAAISDPCTINGDEIEVSPGTYYEAINFNGKAIRLYSSGGATVTIINGSGLVEKYHVVQCISGEDANTILEGFTITGGFAFGSELNDFSGAGMFNWNSSPTVTNCTFSDNDAVLSGGGMYNSHNSSPTVTNCTFSDNHANFGGGMCNEEFSSPTVTNSTFSGNEASQTGGGMGNSENSSPTVTNCTFSGNTASLGGGMGNLYSSSPTVTNCTFSGNEAPDAGGGMCNHNSSPTVTNCTFSGNWAVMGGGMCNVENSSPTVTNCILWNNNPDEIYNYNSTSSVTYCDVRGGWPGTGNIDADPLFVDAANNDLRLGDCSPCVDAGDNAAVPGGITTDLAGNPRFMDDDGVKDCGVGTPPIVDMGVYERQINSFGPIHNVTGGFYYIQIQAAIDGADPNNEIEVAPGTYYETINFNGKAIRLYSSGGPTATIINGGGSFHVVQCINGEDANTVLEGFTITGGIAYGSYPDDCGGGMYCENSSPTVTNCTFNDNRADSDGGGMYNSSSSPTVTNCTFSGNSADYYDYGNGGGMYNEQSSPTVTDCTFSGNSAFSGGGMYNDNSNPTVTDCNFSGNQAHGTFFPMGSGGGGLYNNDNSSPTVTNCTFSGNSADYGGGGGLYNNDNSSPTVTNCTFSGNQAGKGGAMYNYNSSSPTVTNCTFSGNSADYGGGGMYNYNSSPTVTNCTFSGNSTGFGSGGGMYNRGSSPTVTNCILWGNAPDEIYEDTSSSTTVSYSDVRGGWGGDDSNNINANPVFYDAAAGDLRLGAWSPCVDAGNNAAVPADVNKDLGGNPRFADDACVPDTGSGTPPIVDMGAYERQVSSVVWGTINVPGDFDSIQEAIFEACTGDQIIVAPGTYYESIDFLGKAVRLYSSGGPEVTTIDGTGHYHVVQCVSGEGPNTILEGFTITGGNANGFSPDDRGGGMYNYASSPTITSCIFTGNVAKNGGGILNFDCNPTVTNCKFENNTAFGAIGGGGMYDHNSSPLLTNCTFSGNTGGPWGGGGMFNAVSSNPTLINCTFNNNNAVGEGGGMYNWDGTMPILTNCTFSGNSATNNGGGMFNRNDSSPTVTNCILWADAPDEIYDYNSTSIVTCSDVEGGWPGTGNINADPMFALTGDIHLLSGSPCIDAGSNASVLPGVNYDMEGTQRILDGDEDGTATVDMGPYEYNPDPCSPRMAVWPLAFEFIAYGGQAPEPELLEIRSIGAGTINWLIDTDCYWLELNRTGGQSSGEIDNVILDPNISGLVAGEYHCTVTITDPNAINSPVVIPAVLNFGDVREVPAEYSTIQSAIDDSSDGDIVLVIDGIYDENGLDFGGRAIIVMSENGPESCIIDCNDRGRGFYFHSGETGDSILDGFTIQDANAPEDANGGGIYCQKASPIIRNCYFNNCKAKNGGGVCAEESSATLVNCQFNDNNASNSGGGIRNHNANLTVVNCTFSGNSAFGGGGMYNDYYSSPTVADCTFSGNSAGDSGGGMYNNDYSSPTVTNCTFSGNSASSHGGGMYNSINSSPTVTNCTFGGNSATNGGGGMFNYKSSPTVTNCTFSDNEATDILNFGGGGMCNYDNSSPTVTNCTFSGNSAADNGGGMYNYLRNSSPTVKNCTFSGNSASSQGGGMYNNDSSPTVTNCILWGNTPTDPQIYDGSPTVTYSCIQDDNPDDSNVYPGTDNIDDDPFFVDAEANDLRLQVMSPCIDIGRNIAGIYCDIRGSVRPIDVVAEGQPWNNDFDMGACEYSDYYSGTEDGSVPAFRDVEMPSFCLVGEPAEIRWKNHAGFPDDDRRIYLPGEYQVNLVLVSEDWTRQITLNREPITVPSTTITPDVPYSHEYTFRQAHAGTWYLRVELSEDRNQYVESAQTFLIGLRQPTLFEIGSEIIPPFDADLSVDPEIEEGLEDYFFWSEYAGALYATGPIAAVVEWTDTRGDPLPVLVGNVWPDEMQIHVADSPAVELLAAGSPFSFAEVRYAENDAALNGSQFSATSEGRCVLMYGDNANYEFEPEFEVVRTVLWNNPEHLREAEWHIGTEVTEADHDDDCGSGHIYHQISPYDASIYDRDTRSGQIFAVNLDDPCSVADDLIVFWYEKGIYGADWPHLPMRYDPHWPSTGEGLEKIVIASCLGSEVYGQKLLDATHVNMQIYNQPDPGLPGYNPNDEHAGLFPSKQSAYQAVFALRNDLNRTDWGKPNRYTSEPYVLLKYQDIYDMWYYRVFEVLLEDANFVLRYAAEAGQLIQPPYPLDQLLSGCHGDSYADPGPWWTDYNGRIWARCATDAEPGTIHWFYPLVTGFYYDLDVNSPVYLDADLNSDWIINFKDLAKVAQWWGQQDCGVSNGWCDGADITNSTAVDYYDVSEVAASWLDTGFYYDQDNDGVQDEPVGTCVPWLSYHTYPNDEPITVAYDLSWPSDVPELEVGETLMKPKRGLPEISNQCSVEIIYDEPNEVSGTGRAVKLIRPLSEHRVDCPIVNLNGIRVRDKAGMKVFDDLPFHLRTRFYYDTVNQELVFKGYFDDTVVGEPILLLNVITDREKTELQSIPNADVDFKQDVNDLYSLTQQALEENQTKLVGGTKALSAGGANGVGYVTLAFAGDVNCSPLPISVEVIRVVCGPYRGEVKVIESDNVFDERLTLKHSGDFGGRPEGRLFYWKYSYSADKPNEPNRPRPEDNWLDWGESGDAVVDITVGGTGIISLQDLWFSCRYYDELCAEWSLWTEPQLHESWIKRVMRQVNLFDQRYKDFHESEINTLVNMVSQIGPPYEGDVALTADPENMNQIGMLELYETLFRRAKEFSIDQGYNNLVANRTLLFATSRIAALYTLLGNEAYGDALDPTIGFTTEGADYGVMAPTIHCFQNQTDSLLSEELALLRGVESDPYPQPLYNRLIWNFTSGDGEVAYATNYVVTDMDADGDIDEYDAQILYPQGHGDAWGHYLMALKTYYRLLVNPNYTWVPQPEYVLVAGTPVEVDYFDERQFAKIAAARAKTGAEIVDLTYRQKFDEDPENQWQGYKDSDTSRAWGVSGWASRTGQGAYFDWVVANALLPDEDPNESHTGLQKVDRTTVLEIGDIASSFNQVQAKLDMADLGLNPLGVAKDAIPFDINPYELVDALGQPSGRTHFEQIYDRALTALNNALTAFNFANQNTQLLRRQQDTLVNFVNNVADREADFCSRLAEIFGYPYSDDIGPAGTYPEDYEGPDIYHFMYVDSSELMSASSPKTIEFTVTFREPQVGPDGALSYESRDVVFELCSNGLGFVKPASWTGSRRAPGELQMARSELLQAKANFDRALLDYSNLLVQIEDQAEILQAQYDLDTTELYVLDKTHNQQESLNDTILVAEETEFGLRTAARIAVLVANAVAEALPTSAGFSTDFTSVARGAIKAAGAVISETCTIEADLLSIDKLAAQQAKERAQSLSNIELTAARDEFAELQQLKQLEQLVRTEASQRLGLLTLAETMQQASGRYLAALARGEAVYQDLLRFRRQTAASIQQYRYKDLSFRVFRNEALQKYRAQFDMAAMYAYLAAKAYDYETALLDDYSEAGQHFLNRIVKQRALGTISEGTAMPGGGLAGALAELKQNFDVFKTMMGFNNPQIETTWFSLRKENFRIADYAVSNPDWQKELDKYYVYDLWELPEFRRYCKPFDTEDVALPGFVIPFQTNITNALNFFGWPGGADPFYAPENFVTKIRSVGVWFSNYDTTIMSPTPRVYLIPVGQDVVRADIGEIRSWQVVEQSIPLPFQIDEYDLANNFEWIPMNDSVPGPFAEIRRYTRFRAYPDGGFNPDEMTYDSRLIGRSVWNTRWLLIIPGHSLYLSDPWEGMERFISGAAIPGGDGERTGNGVTDIKLFFKTYAYPGY